MQFNDKVTATFSSYNNFGEEISPVSSTVKCRIMKLEKKNKRSDKSDVEDYDAELLIPGKNYSPYTELMSNDSLMFTIESTLYSVNSIEAIRGFGGKVKYYSAKLSESDAS